jgi:two-component system, OmpR family, sensor kinase
MRFRRRVGLQIFMMLAVLGTWTVIAVCILRLAPRLGGVVPVMTGFFFLMVGLGAGRAIRRIARPIELLTDASRRFGAGDLSTRVTLPPWWQRAARWRRLRHPRRRHHGLDELVDLGDAWNDMAERIERLVRGQRELLANVSHELRSPLARVRVALELLPRTPETEARFADVVADLEELDRLIDDVLTATRLDTGTFPLHPDEVDVVDLFEGIATRAAHDPLTSGSELRIEADGVGVVRADAGLLRRALWNLVENAAKYGAPPVVLRAERQAENVVLSVEDDGPGIPAEARARVLEPFVRLDEARTPAAERRGVGLGLTIAGRIAAAHGGSLSLSGERGLRVAITLPD